MTGRRVALGMIVTGMGLVAASLTLMRERIVECRAGDTDAIVGCVTHNVGLLDGAMGPDTVAAGLGAAFLVAGLTMMVVPRILSARRHDLERERLESRRAERAR